MFFLDKEPKITEKEIQILYQTHPYLIEKVFLNQKVVPQYFLPSGYADIVIFLENEIVIIELKVEPLESSHLLQLKGYLEDIKNQFKAIKTFRGILIGRDSNKDLYSMTKSIPFDIKILILDKDIPTNIKICDSCRLANKVNNENCNFCNNNSFF